MGKVIMELKDVTKYFPGVVALDSMSFEIQEGVVHGLIGENGAGKSTLIKILTGVHQPDRGQILIDGKEVVLTNPIESKKIGIGCIYQELNIVPQLSITDNLFLNDYIQKTGPILNYDAMHKRAKEVMLELGQDIDPKTECSQLGLGVQQIVEIGRAILNDLRLIIMDEPTSSLSENEIEQLYKTIETLTKKNVAVIFVSHKLEEIFECCDDVTVMRDGKFISKKPIDKITKDELIYDMVGRSLDNLFPKIDTVKGSEALRVESLNYLGVLDDISFSAYNGQILGFSGLVGAGRTETMRSIFGADPRDTGEIYIHGKKVEIRSPRDAINNGIAFLTESRQSEGLILDDTVLNNLSLATIDQDKKGIFIDDKKRKKRAEENVKQFKIRTPSIETPSGSLSGGNQQKVVIGKWVNADADIYIFDEPTRGIDVGAKIEVYNVMNSLVSDGKCVIMVSSELPEILGMSDSVIIMREGQILAEIDRESEHFNEQDIMKVSWGGTLDD